MACFDCNDADAMTYPGVAEMISKTECLTDADEDGYGASTKDLVASLFLEKTHLEMTGMVVHISMYW